QRVAGCVDIKQRALRLELRTQGYSLRTFCPRSKDPAALARQRDRAADGNLTAGDDLGIDAEVTVTPGTLQVGRQRHVAHAARRVHVGRLAPGRAREHAKRAGSQSNLPVDPAELGPRRDAVKVEVGAKA